MDIYTLLLAVVMKQSAEQISAENGQQLRSCTQQRQVMRNVTCYTAVPHFNVSGIGVRCNERTIERRRQVHIGSSNNRNKCIHDSLSYLVLQRYNKNCTYANFYAFYLYISEKSCIFAPDLSNERKMIYRFTFSCVEGDPSFRRVFEADADATFLQLHEAILKSVGYPDDQMTSFFLCNEDWEKGQEVTLVEMDSNFEYDNMVMNETRLSDLIEEQGQRLIYVFDPMFERYFFGSLKEIKPGAMNGVECVESKGKAPKQLKSEDPLAGVGKGGDDDFMLDDEFKDEYDLGDIDMEGFQDLSFDDGTMF